MKLKLSILAAIASFNSVVLGAAISITVDSGGKSIQDENGVALSGGSPTVDADGTSAVLGYFQGATAAAPFGTAGSSFVALTGSGTPFGFNFTVGDLKDNGAGNGELFLNAMTFNTGVADSLLPAVNTPLVVRFFNAASTRLLDVSNAVWLWKTPDTPASTVSINFDNAGLVQRGTGSISDPIDIRTSTAVVGSAVRTTTPVPEPSSVLLLLAGGGLAFARRRRK